MQDRRSASTLVGVSILVVACQFACTPQDNKADYSPVPPSRTMKICDNCGKNNALVHFIAKPPLDDTQPADVPRSLCESCGKDFIRSLPRKEQLLFAAGFRPGERALNVVKQYVVATLNVQGNESELEIVTGDHGRSVGSKIYVRADMLPSGLKVGDRFSVSGTPLELDVFESSRGE